MEEDLPFNPWWAFWRRCGAVKEYNKDGFYGRCELERYHNCDHALERGFDFPRWSTKWTG